jgi:subtilisin-like proprotein convertase family protein
MKHLILLCLLSLVSVQNNAQQIWEPIQETTTLKQADKIRTIVPDKFGLFALDYKSMAKQLSYASNESIEKSNHKTIDFALPLPEGGMITMRFVESPNMSHVLSAKFPDIKAYRGYNPDNPSEHARIDFGPMGFHAAIVTRKGTIYIDPYYTFADEKYMSYYIKDHHVDMSNYPNGCGYNHYNEEIKKEEALYESPEPITTHKKSIPVIRRTYRMALACTGAWGSIWGTPENVMSKFNTGVNRFNITYENEVGIHFELIDDNDKLIFFTENEPYTSPNLGGETLRENTSVINNTVGSNSYDIGHVFTTFCTDGVAGIAFGGSVCRNNKGGGVSCIGTSDISNFIAQTGAHEVGHQFSGGHSWDNCPGNDAQRSPSTGWEPGSGSTVLSYSGLCGNNNVVGPSDEYFHVGNINQFYDFVEASSCGILEESGNNTPDLFVDIPDGLTIPISTPFELDGTAVDPDGDVLTYNWEQMDLNSTPSQLGSPMGNAPSFRSLPPSTNTLRSFPRIGSILAGIGNPREVLPTYNRDLTFRFTVRDNHPGTGVTVWEEVKFRSTDTAGPFTITAPRQITFVEVNEAYNVEWDVANTDNDIVNCQTVDIFLSTDGGGTFDIQLANDVPNDGSHSVIIPNALTNSGRIKVKASNNVFFNIGRGEMIIRAPSAPGFYIDIAENEYNICLPENLSVGITGTSFQDFQNDVTLDIVSGLPPNASFEFTNNPMTPDGLSMLNMNFENVTESGSYEVIIEGTSQDANTISQRFLLEINATDMSDLSLVSPESGLEGISGTPVFEWTQSINAESYRLEVSTTPEFGVTNIIDVDNITGRRFVPQIILDNSTLYYWRISGSNKCVEAFESEIYTFGTISLSCNTYAAEDTPINISQSGTSSISSVINVFEQGTIADVNINKIDGGHGRSRDLVATLINPAGDSVELWNEACSGADFNLGFDSESPIQFQCPLNGSRTMQLESESLTKFNGSETEGEWRLVLEDTRPGEGGRLNEFILELCSSTSFDKPFLVNNNVLEVPTGAADKIFSNQLLSQDNNNTADELLYTLVVNTTKGTLFLRGAEMTVGSRFTQADIDAGAIRYVHNGTEDESDRFIFTVIDGEGGFIDLTEFIINTDASFISSTDELGNNDIFRVYPNPASQTLHIYNKENTTEDWNVVIYNIDGQVVHTDRMQQKLSLDIHTYEQGLYLIHLSDGNTYYTHKVNIIK